jgi:hypothetical protein
MTVSCTYQGASTFTKINEGQKLFERVRSNVTLECVLEGGGGACDGNTTTFLSVDIRCCIPESRAVSHEMRVQNSAAMPVGSVR